MIRDHRPYFIKKAYLRFQQVYVNHFIRPQLESLGGGFTFFRPWNVKLFGAPIIIGRFVNVIASHEKKVRLSIWTEKTGRGRIEIGDCCLICPGVRISSALEVVIGDNCMLAGNAYITDSDWHDIYNRIITGKSAPVRLGKNVWLGDSAIVCKGVTIGENSIIGAGAVVTNDVPPNSIAAGNPANVVKRLEPKEKLITRAEWFSDWARLSREIDELDKESLKGNTVLSWLRRLLFPQKGD